MGWEDLLHQHWPQILGHGVGALLLAAVLASLARMARGEAKRNDDADVFILRYAKGWRALFELGALATLGVLAAMVSTRSSRWRAGFR